MEAKESGSAARVLEWVAEEWRKTVAAILETFIGEAVETSAASGAAPEGLSWQRIDFDLAPGASVFVGVDPEDRNRIAGAMLEATSGSSEAQDEAEAAAVCEEYFSQAAAGLAQALTNRLGRETAPSGKTEAPPPPESSVRVVTVRLPGGAEASQWLAVSAALADIVSAPQAPAPDASLEPPRERARLGPGTAGGSCGGVEVLLDVELPVSASFGRAHLPLKDVLKLTSGSIVELNRSVSEPVEIIVNNCVIARGEVVVVEGNYGVRITEIISRCERLRTLI